jgi:hypothetical protein
MVELTHSFWLDEALSNDTSTQYLGGICLDAALFYLDIPSKADLIEPDAILRFMTGLLGQGSDGNRRFVRQSAQGEKPAMAAIASRMRSTR